MEIKRFITERRAAMASATALGLLAILVGNGCLGAPAPTVPVTPTPRPAPTAESTPVALSTDWQVCADIREGEGVFAALERVAGETPREKRSGLMNKVQVKDDKGKVWEYGYSQLIDESPVVKAGWRVCDTLKDAFGNKSPLR